MFTDPAVLTGPVAKSELDIRAIGFFLVVPTGLDETAIQKPALPFCAARTAPPPSQESRRACMPLASGALPSLSAKREADWFGQRQRFLATAAELAENRRLSRFLFVAEKPAHSAAAELLRADRQPLSWICPEC